MIEYDPYSEEMMDDPFPTYVRLRSESPAHYVEKYDCWAISRFADIVNVGMDAKNFTMTSGSTAGHLMGGGLEVDTSIFMSMDPPAHTPRRALVSSLFKMRRILKRELTSARRGVCSGGSMDMKIEVSTSRPPPIR